MNKHSNEPPLKRGRPIFEKQETKDISTFENALTRSETDPKSLKRCKIVCYEIYLLVRTFDSSPTKSPLFNFTFDAFEDHIKGRESVVSHYPTYKIDKRLV